VQELEQESEKRSRRIALVLPRLRFRSRRGRRRAAGGARLRRSSVAGGSCNGRGSVEASLGVVVERADAENIPDEIFFPLEKVDGFQQELDAAPFGCGLTGDMKVVEIGEHLGVLESSSELENDDFVRSRADSNLKRLVS